MSKEIYKEYLCKWVDAVNLNDMVKLNESYILNELTFANVLKNIGKANIDLLDLHDDTYESIKRAPKTQMINGHEVVAPRYDMPEHREDIIVMNCFRENGIEVINFSAKTMRAVISWGWFSADNTKDAIAYANAHRENKSD